MNEELAKYQGRLDRLLFSESPDIFGNYSQPHAKCIFRTFFSVASESIDCLSGDFGTGIFQEPGISDALRCAVIRGAHVRVISLGTSAESMENLRTLRDNLNAVAAISGKGGSFDYRLGVVRDPHAEVQHYMVVDKKRYRLEAPHPAPVREDVHAEVCCNGPVKGAYLTRDFDSIWGRLSCP